MNAKDAIFTSLGMAENVTKSYLKDLTDADLLVRPVPGMNHMAWQLGHLLTAERSFVEHIRPGASPAVPENFEEGHGRHQTNIDDPSKYLTLEQYSALYEAQRAATKKVLAEISDAELDAPGPEALKGFAPTNGATLMLIANHELMHVGQYVAVRRALGKAVAI